MYAIVKRLSDGGTFPGNVHELTYARMTPSVYEALVKELPVIAVNNDTSPMQAGFQLGVQTVLKKLRDGFLLDVT